MAFRVEVSPEALENLDAIASYIKQRGSFESAERWLNSIIEAIATLAEFPARCPIAAESQVLKAEVRVLLHGKRNHRYKVFYAVAGDTVRVFHIRHWAKRPLTTEELLELINPGSRQT